MFTLVFLGQRGKGLRHLFRIKRLAAKNHHIAALFIPKGIHRIVLAKLLGTGGAQHCHRTARPFDKAQHAVGALVQVNVQHRCTFTQLLVANHAGGPAAQGVFQQKAFAVFAFLVDIVQRGLNILLHFFLYDGLQQVILHTQAYRLFGILKLAVGRQQNAVGIWGDAAHLLDQFQSVHARHTNIGNQQVNLLLFKQFQCRHTVRGRQQFVHAELLPVDAAFQYFKDTVLIVC